MYTFQKKCLYNLTCIHLVRLTLARVEFLNLTFPPHVFPCVAIDKLIILKFFLFFLAPLVDSLLIPCAIHDLLI